MTMENRSSRDESPRAQAVRTSVGLALRLVRQWWPHLAALAAASGVVAATIAGALGVGEALTRGLQRLALARLGGIQAAVITDGFFRTELADETAARLRGPSKDGGAPPHGPTPPRIPMVVPALVLEVSVQSASAGPSAAAGDRGGRTARATLLACDDLASLGFTSREQSSPAGPSAHMVSPSGDTVAINRTLADAIGARPGDAVILRVAKVGDVPADSPLGRRTADSWSRRLRVADVLPPEGLAEFSLRPTQVTGGLAVTSLSTARTLLRRSGPVANTLFSCAGGSTKAGAVSTRDTAVDDAKHLPAALQPSLEDLGLIFEQPAGSGAWRLSSRRLLLPPAADRAAQRVLGALGGRPTLAFLANAMTPLVDGRPGSASIPYSTVVGVDTASLPVGDLVDDGGVLLRPPGPDEIVIDRWMADDLESQGTPIAVGDRIALRSFLPETLHGRVEETECTLTVSGIAAMQGAALARDLVPEVEGITDEASIADWDPPFPFDRNRVRTSPPHDEDDRYWKAHGATPKAFVSLDVARRLAGSRFGVTTSWHLPRVSSATVDATRAALVDAIDIEGMGMQVVPLRARAMAAARGSTPFGGLFLALSSFVVGSGLLLEWLLFSLLVAARRRDVGILAAIGWPSARVARLLVLVAGAAAVGGAVAGTLLGPIWGAFLLERLSRAWNTSVAAGSSAVFIRGMPAFDASVVRGLLPAAVAAVVVSLAAVSMAARRASRLPPLTLLKPGSAEAAGGGGRTGAFVSGLALTGPVVAVGLAWWARRGDPQAAVGMFFAAGAAALAGLLAVVVLALGRGAVVGGRPLHSLPGLAWRGLVEARFRAFSVAAIVACAEFLIVSVSSFSVQLPPRPDARDAPTGGWTLMATFGSPTGVDPADPIARDSLGLSDADRNALAACTIARIRSSAGDDASCANLYATTQPTVLGVGGAFIERGGFRFVDHAPIGDASRPASSASGENPWMLLEADLDTEPRGPSTPRPIGGATTAVTPVVIDQATAQWALKLGGVGARFELPVDGGKARFEIVGLLEPGILQGFLIVSERNFQRLYPQRAGYSVALVDAGAGATAAQTDRVSQAVAAAWADAAVTVTRTADRLRSLQAVQNTFLAAFQSLGTLGLVLGAAGVAAVQFQSVLERRGALSLLAAIGFKGVRLRLVVVLETLLMVALGLAVGTLAGCLALVPLFATGRAGVPVGWIASTWALTMAAAVVAGWIAARRIVRLEPARVLAEAG